MAPVPKKANIAKSGRSTVADSISFGNINVSKEDVKTLAAMIRFGEVQGDAEYLSQKLGITKNAWAKRWKRVKTKMERVPLVTVDGPATSANVEPSSDAAPEETNTESENRESSF